MKSKFYKTIYNNLDSNKIFYRYKKESFKYKDIKIFYYNFLKIISNLIKNKIKFVYLVKNHSISMPA